jgi:hypothetical protein
VFVSGLAQPTPHVLEQGMQRSMVKLAQTPAGQDDNIQIVQISTLMSEGLAGDTFDPVAINCPPDILLGNDQPQSCVCQAVMPGQQQNIGARGLTGGSIEYVLELCWRQ